MFHNKGVIISKSVTHGCKNYEICEILKQLTNKLQTISLFIVLNGQLELYIQVVYNRKLY